MYFPQRDPSRQRLGILEATGQSVQSRLARKLLNRQLTFLGRLVTFREDPSQLGGPITIARYAGQAAQNPASTPTVDMAFQDQPARQSSRRLYSLAAFISISIGFLNLLPIPVLDGGHLVYYAYEAIAGRPLSDRVQAIGFRIGMVMVGSLIIFVVVNDVFKLFQA